MPFGAWTPRRAALAAVLILIVINLAVASMLGGIVAAIVMPLFGVDPDTKLFGAANGLIEKSTMLAVGVLCLAFLARPRIASHFGLTGRPIGGWLRVVAAGVLGAVAITSRLPFTRRASASKARPSACSSGRWASAPALPPTCASSPPS